MNIVQINNTDLTGRRFNGFDLHLLLNKLGHLSKQYVTLKKSEEQTVHLLDNFHAAWQMQTIAERERFTAGTASLWNPLGKALINELHFKEADIVHYHLIHNGVISLLDFPILAKEKPSVWTVHDPWAVTGGCIYPLECQGWRDGCNPCNYQDTNYFLGSRAKAAQMFLLKQQLYSEMDIDIVVASEFSRNYLKQSPLTSHFRRTHKIPFGIDLDSRYKNDSKRSKEQLKIPQENDVIAFRYEKGSIKSGTYILSMLDHLERDRVTLLTCGHEILPKEVSQKYHVVELGWQNDMDTMTNFYSACDLFLTPSLAESFGVMPIEAMAHEKPVIVFDNTVLPEITFAPKCGFTVPYKDSGALASAVKTLMNNPDERKRRGSLGRQIVLQHYRYEDYVRRHIELFEEILDRRKKRV